MDAIQKQYNTPRNLDIRISIHEKYSVNRQPFGDWIMEHYEITPGSRILELGCGTGSMWKGKLDVLENGSRLTLTDFSQGMLERAKQNTVGCGRVDYRVVDIQDIPYEDASFDIVIANMMLYHVPDLPRGLSEVRRVLRPGGKFYCATYGEHGIMEFVNNSLRELGIHGEIGGSFTLQNGAAVLGAFFEEVRRDVREDGLAVTRVEDFVDYVLSMSALTGVTGVGRDTLCQAFGQRTIDGILYVPKEYGMFICK